MFLDGVSRKRTSLAAGTKKMLIARIFLVCEFRSLNCRLEREQEDVSRAKNDTHCKGDRISKICESNKEKRFPIFRSALFTHSKFWKLPFSTSCVLPRGSFENTTRRVFCLPVLWELHVWDSDRTSLGAVFEHVLVERDKAPNQS